MLQTKFRRNQPTGSGEKDVSRVFTIYGHLHLMGVKKFRFTIKILLVK